MNLIPSVLSSSLLAVFFSAGVLPITNSAAGDAREIIKLPQPPDDSTTSVEKALRGRRSVRHFKNHPLSLPDLSQLLWAAQGASGRWGKRTAPSAGALYPLELYVVAGNVTGLAAGVYLYKPARHELNRTIEGDARAELSNAALRQSSVRDAAAVLVFSAVYERTTIKYGQRGIRYVHMEAGHAAQNVCLQAVSLNLGTVVIGAFHDEQVKAVLHLPEQEQPLTIMPLGRL